MIDLQQHPDKQWAQKLPIPMNVKFADSSGICVTLEGQVSFIIGDAILTGMSGEHWPIERAKFEATYEPISPTHMGENGQYVKKPIPVLVLELNKPIQVNVGWQSDPLQGQIGDWLVQYDPYTFGIVSKSIFHQTYRLL
jgi:hypothetical protein